MADGQAMASKFVDHGATSSFVGIDDHHRTLHTGSTVLQREVDRSHGPMAAALQGHRWTPSTCASMTSQPRASMTAGSCCGSHDGTSLAAATGWTSAKMAPPNPVRMAPGVRRT